MKVVRGRVNTGSENRSDSANFSGTVYGDAIYRGDELTVNTVSFFNGGRTNWHVHEGGQILLVTAGKGWVFDDQHVGGEIVAGDLVWTAPGEKHWHGAASNTLLVHTAISIGGTKWLEEVEFGLEDEEDYTSEKAD